MLSEQDLNRLRDIVVENSPQPPIGSRDLCALSRLEHTNPLRRMALEIASYRLAEHEREVAAKDVQEIPSPPLGRELGRSPIPTGKEAQT